MEERWKEVVLRRGNAILLNRTESIPDLNRSMTKSNNCSIQGCEH